MNLLQILPLSKHRSKTQTSQFKTSLKTYTFDENSLRMALIFAIVYGYWRADFAFFFWSFGVYLYGQQEQATVKRRLPLLV